MERLGLDKWFAASETAIVVSTTAVATAALVILAKAALWPANPKVIPSPLKTVVPHTPRDELAHLVYQPDQFPGARDVETPYGSIRVYEFGPEDGQKVLLLHGISTSCITNSLISELLVHRGCRVMLFDLFGRGFSDGVGDLPHDVRLYTTQILLALASSPLPWTGNDAFRLIGYSLGGGIAIHFANAFPHLVSSLVLLAPAGLIRAAAFGTVTRFVFSSGAIPERLLAILTRRRLQKPIAPRRKRLQPEAVELAVAEAADPAPGDRATALDRGVIAYVRWMVIHHAGFVPAFMSCIRYAPLTDQHDSWREVAKRPKGTTAVFLGKSDDLIVAADYAEDALPLLGGDENVTWKLLPGGHDFVMTHADEIVKELDEFWGMKAPA